MAWRAPVGKGVDRHLLSSLTSLLRFRAQKLSVRLSSTQSVVESGSSSQGKEKDYGVTSKLSEEQREYLYSFADRSKYGSRDEFLDPARNSAVVRNIKFLEDTLRMSTPQLQDVVLRLPEILTLSRRSMKEKLARYSAELDFGTTSLKQVVLRNPRLLSQSIETVFVPLRACLEEFGFKPDQFSALFERFPDIANYSLNEVVMPFLGGLEQKGIPKEEIIRAILKHPSLTTLSIESNIDVILEWVKSVVGMDEHVFLQNLFSQDACVVLFSSIDELQSNYEWLASLGYSKTSIADRVSVFPKLLVGSAEDKRQLVEFASEYLGKDLDRLLPIPNFFDLGFDRLLPRITYWEYRMGDKKFEPVAELLNDTDLKFAKSWVGVPPYDYYTFMDWLAKMPRRRKLERLKRIRTKARAGIPIM